MNKLDAESWSVRYKNNQTGWDIGHISTPLKTYFQSLNAKNIPILVPGGGNGYEAAYLHEQGFTQVFLLDWAPEPLQVFQENNPTFPPEHLICGDFFEHSAQYDLIVEQTFFCAINPALRPNYVKKVAELLNPGGKLAGLLFSFPLTEDGPPFGGNAAEYQNLFEKQFKINHLSPCYNSIKPREGRELFIEMLRLG